MRICTYKGCDQKHRAKGYCEHHYNVIVRERHSTNISYEEQIRLADIAHKKWIKTARPFERR